MSAANSGKSHQEALVDYLDELLHEQAAVAEDSSAAEPDAVPVIHVAASNQALPEATDWSRATVAYEPVEPPGQAEPVEAESDTAISEKTSDDSSPVAAQADVVREQAQLSCVPVAADDERHYLFEVAGFTVAIAAGRVSAEQSLEGASLESDGLVCHVSPAAQSTIPTIDLASLMLPPDAAMLQQSLRQRASTAALLDDSQWGVLCTGPGWLEDLGEQPVCWRSSDGGRAWLAGTLAERRLVVINLDVLAGMLP